MASTFASLRLDFSLTTTWLHRNDHLQMRKERCERIAQVKSTTGSISVVSEDQNDSVVDRLNPIARTYSFSFLHLASVPSTTTSHFFFLFTIFAMSSIRPVERRNALRPCRTIDPRPFAMFTSSKDNEIDGSSLFICYNRIRKINLFEVNIWNNLSIREMQSLRAERVLN